MAVNKNFVVKNGLEVNTNLLVADLDTQTVGIGTTIAPHELHVVGGIGVTNLNVTGVATIANLRIGGISTFVGFTTFLGDINVGGASTFTGLVDINGGGQANTFKVEDLTDNRVVIAGTGGELEDDGNFTFDGSQLILGVGATVGGGLTVAGVTDLNSTLDVSGNVSLGSSLDVTGLTELGDVNVSAGSTFGGLVDINAGGQANTFKVEDLTDNRVVLAGTGGELEDSGNLTFDGTQLVVTGVATVSGAMTAGSFSVGNNQVISSARQLQNIASLDSTTTATIESAIANAPNTFTDIEVTGIATFKSTVKVEDLAPDRVVFVGAGDSLTDDANFTFDRSQLILGVGATVGGALTVAGALDVNSTVDFAADISIGAGATVGFGSTAFFRDNAKAIFGNGEDLEIFHDGSNSFIRDAGTGSLHVQGRNLVLEDIDGENYLTAFLNGQVALFFDNGQKLETANDGVKITGGVNVSGISTFSSGVGIADSIFHVGDDNTQIRFPSADNFTVETGGSERLRIGPTGISTFTGDISLIAGGAERLNLAHVSGGDVLIKNPTDAYLAFGTNDTERLRITNTGFLGLGTATPLNLYRSFSIAGPANDQGGVIELTTLDKSSRSLVFNDSNGLFVQTPTNHSITFRTNGANDRLVVTNAGDVDFKGANGITSMSFDRSSNSLDFVDNAKAQFGTGDDLQIYHNGTVSRIDNNVGVLQIRNLLDDSDISLQTDNGSGGAAEYVLCDGSSGSVLLKHYGNTKLETTSDGVIATGIVTATGGFALGIHSAGTSVVSGPVKTLNFVGSGNTFAYNASTDTIDISIAGGSGGGSGVTETDTTVSTTNPTGVGSFATASFRSASVIAQINQLNTDFQVGRYLMIHDGTTVTVVEESAVSTGSTMLGSFTGVIDGSNVELRVTLASAGVSTVTTKIDTVTV